MSIPQAIAAKATAKVIAAKTNVLLITVDDMNYDSLGVTGCKVANISPHIDKLSSQGIRFDKAHVTIAVCQPTRAVWMTGLYPFHNGALGFQKIKPGIKTLPEVLEDEGYFNGIMAKVPHVVPSRAKHWHHVVKANELGVGREPTLYYKHAKAFLAKAKEQGKPFFLMANSQDPHRPFANSDQENARTRRKNRNPNNPKVPPKPHEYPEELHPYKPADVTVPGFLPDLPLVRLEMSEYYTSVRRADAITGAVLRALDESGMADNTIVMFKSDHGMPLPFAKTNCWYHSTRTPWIVRWPSKIKPGRVDDQHFVSGVDLMPTVLDALEIKSQVKMDGRSFLPVLLGKEQAGRETVYTTFHTTAGGNGYEMRSIYSERHYYIYNSWSNGKAVFRNESQSGRTMKAMNVAAKTDAAVAARVKHFVYRTPDEMYDYQTDRDALKNLTDDPKFAAAKRKLQERMLNQMETLEDPLLARFKRFLANGQ